MNRVDPVGELLEAMAARTPALGGGAVAGLACALGAALAAMGARFAGREKRRPGPTSCAGRNDAPSLAATLLETLHGAG